MQTMRAKRLLSPFSGCLLALLLLAGCATRPQAPEATPAATVPAATASTPTVRPEPDAVYNLESGTRALPRRARSIPRIDAARPPAYSIAVHHARARELLPHP